MTPVRRLTTDWRKKERIYWKTSLSVGATQRKIFYSMNKRRRKSKGRLKGVAVAVGGVKSEDGRPTALKLLEWHVEHN
jgi:hypothetical protein